MEYLKNFNIKKIIELLSQRRPIFHNERDLQFEFALLLKELYNSDVRLEYFYSLESANDKHNKRNYIDIVLQNSNDCILIELKYKTKTPKETIIHNGELFLLQNHGAQDYGCYSVLSDLSRIEKVKEINGKKVIAYYSVLLTNDLYYLKGFKQGTLFSNYSLRHNRIIPANQVLDFCLNNKLKSQTCAAGFTELSFLNEYNIYLQEYSKHLYYMFLGKSTL